MQEPAGGARSGYALSAAGGTLIGICWLPLGLAPLLPLAFLLLVRGLGRARTAREAALMGVLTGAVEYAVASHFLLALVYYSLYGAIYYLLAILFIVPFAAFQAWAAFWLERRTGLPRGLAFAGLWVLMEKARTLGDLSFPADLMAHGFGTAPAFLASAAWLGPFGMTLLAACAGFLLDRALDARGAARWVPASAAAALWLLPPAVDLALAPRAAEPAGAPALRIGIVQPSVPPDEKLRREQWPAVWAHLRELTLEAARGNELVLWPETARPGFALVEDGAVRDAEMADLAREAGVPILYGTILLERRGGVTAGLYNGAALVRPDGTFGGWYGKQRLLPFVEGMPFGRLYGWDPQKRGASGPRQGYFGLLGNFSAGPEPTIFEVGPARIAVLVCYEGMYPQLGRAARAAGANTLAVITNDMWWGRTVFPPWHARMIAARARELDLPVVRAANNGVSSLTDRRGRLLARTGLGETRTLAVTVHPVRTPPTFYARSGDLVVLAVVTGLAVPLARSVVRRRPAAPVATTAE